MILAEILVPLLNANEPEARVAAVHVRESQPVKKGSLLFTIETTKAAAEVESTGDGHIRLLATEGDVLRVGERLAVLTDTQNESLEVLKNQSEIEKTVKPEGATPANLRITKPALSLAKSLGIDLASLPAGVLVTEAVVHQYAKRDQALPSLPASQKPYILIYGAGGHAKTLMDMIQGLDQFTIAGIVDDNVALSGTKVHGIPVLGPRAALPELMQQGVKLAANGVGGILDISIRARIFEQLEAAGFELPILIHPRATVEPSAKIEAGVQVFANAYIGTEAVLHAKCMVNTNAVVSHDCQIGEYSHIAPGALLAGQVQVGARALIGMGVTTSIGVSIGSGVRVGNGAILLADVPDKTIIQAGRFWTGKTEIAR